MQDVNNVVGKVGKQVALMLQALTWAADFAVAEVLFGRRRVAGGERLEDLVTMGIFEEIINFIENIWFLLYVMVIRFTRWMTQVVLWGKVSSGGMDRLVLLVGDGIAEGIGDGLAYGGLSLRLGRMLVKEKKEGLLKMHWSVANCGFYRSNSEDWLPGGGRPPKRALHGVKKSLFVDTFVEGKFKDADVVVLFIGGEDESTEEDMFIGTNQTVANIKALTVELQGLNKQVVIATIPAYSDDKEVKDRVRQRNHLIKQFIEGTEASTQDKRVQTISLGPDINVITSQGGYLLDPVEDGLNLSSHGFRLLTRLTFDAVLNPCRRIEWAYWRQRLS